MISTPAAIAAPPSARSSQPSTGDTPKDIFKKQFNTYLKLLTASLKYQDPQNPMSGKDVAKQMLEISSLQLQARHGDELKNIRLRLEAQRAENSIGYIGTQVQIDGAGASHTGNGALWQLRADAETSASEIRVRNSRGDIVHTASVTLTSGPNSFRWDGHDAPGVPQPAGTYTLEIDARDDAGHAVGVEISHSATVTAVDLSQSEPRLHVGDQTVPLSSIRWVSRQPLKA